MSENVSISVIVCVHMLDRLRDIRAMIASVEAQSYPDYSLIIICDNSESTYAVLKTEFPHIAIVKNAFEKGLSGARNTGIVQSQGDVIAFLDDDAAAEPDWLEKLANVYRDPAVIAAGGKIRPAWPDRRPGWFPAEFDWVIGCSYRGQPSSCAPVRNLIGCNMSARRSVFKEAGGFRTSLGRNGTNAAGCEETEFFIRVKSKVPDGIILYEPDATVHHQVTPERCTWTYFFRRCRAEGRSKAAMVRLVGSETGLASERGYVTSVLPAGILRNLADTARGDLHGLTRAGALVSGLAATSVSYFLEKFLPSSGKSSADPMFSPIQIVEWDLDCKDTSVLMESLKPFENYGGALCLIRSKGVPVAVKEIRFDAASRSGMSAADPFEPPPEANRTHLLKMPSGPRRPWVTVVIATRNRTESLLRCLKSLMEQTYSSMDIVVVDNAPSSRATADLIAALFAGGGRVQYVREDRPGLGVAHNTGLAHALGDVVAFTDDDVRVDPNWAAAIASEFAQSGEVGCVTGMIMPAELETRAQYWTERHGGFGKGVVRRVFDTGNCRPDDPLFPYNAGSFGSGANMAFRREALLEVGGFDGALGAGTPAQGGDDLASFVAIINAGYKLVYEPRAIVWHFHRRAEAGMRRQAYCYGVGLGSYLTKQIIEDPHNLARFARQVPAAFTHLFSRTSKKLQNLPTDYPGHLLWRERFGILMGLPSYLKSRNKLRRMTREMKPIPALAVFKPGSE